jgi:hypothetical protein
MTQNITKSAIKIIKPVVLAVALLFLTPLAGMLRLPASAPQEAVVASNLTVVFKSGPASVVYKNQTGNL